MNTKNANTTAQAAKKLGIARATVIQYIRLGYIKAEKIGQIYLISDDEIKKRLAK